MMGALALTQLATAPPRIGPRLARALIGAIGHMLPGATLIDAMAPRWPFAAASQNSQLPVMAPSVPPALGDFLARFRQGGGAHPLFQAESRDPRADLGKLSDIVPAHAPIVFAFDRLADAALMVHSPALQAAALLVRADTVEMPEGASRHAFAGFAPVMLQPRGERPMAPFLLLLGPAHREAGMARLGTGYTAEPFALSAHTYPAGMRALGPDWRFEIPVSADRSLQRDLAAADFVHDGGYQAERADEYSWLWTGPSRHWRLMLGAIPASRALVHVCVIKTEDARNMGGLSVLIDGRPVRHRRDVWSEVSGKLIVEIDAPAPDMSVLSLIVPHLSASGDGSRMLGICLDKVEVLI